MTKHILCAVDMTHSDDAASLLAEAGKLADFYGATLSVITVLPDYNSSWVGSFFKEGMLQEAANSASDTLHDLVRRALPDRKQVQHIVKIGAVYQQVLETIDEIDADLVIVGAHKPDIADKLLGPNSARIARHSPVSTFVVRM